MAKCCGQIVGCGKCIQEWLCEGDDLCILCKGSEFANNVTEVKGFDVVLSKLAG